MAAGPALPVVAHDPISAPCLPAITLPAANVFWMMLI